jgi:hypothetical protein
MINKKIKELDIWVDMFLNPQDHKKTFNYITLSMLCVVGILAIKIMDVK